jgi:hypothetical protein
MLSKKFLGFLTVIPFLSFSNLSLNSLSNSSHPKNSLSNNIDNFQTKQESNQINSNSTDLGSENYYKNKQDTKIQEFSHTVYFHNNMRASNSLKTESYHTYHFSNGFDEGSSAQRIVIINSLTAHKACNFFSCWRVALSVNGIKYKRPDHN